MTADEVGVGGYAGAFLDRDGVINQDLHYVARPARFHFCDGAVKACRRIRAAGYRIIIVSNQGGIALDDYREADYHSVTAYMLGQLRAAGAEIDAVYYCPYHANLHGRYGGWSGWRKPNTGMIRAAAVAHRIDLARSFMAGDKASDMESARRAGILCRCFIGASAPAGAVAYPSLLHCAQNILPTPAPPSRAPPSS